MAGIQSESVAAMDKDYVGNNQETVLFVLLDLLEAIDLDRIARVVDYFRTYADYLVAALLSEDTAMLPNEYAYVEQID